MNRIWLAHEDAAIIAGRFAIPRVPTPVIAAQLDRPVAATFNRALKLKAQVQPHTLWAPEAVEQLRAAMQRVPPPTDKELEVEFGRPAGQIRTKLASMGLTGPRQWRRDVKRAARNVDQAAADARRAATLARNEAAAKEKADRKAARAQARLARQEKKRLAKAEAKNLRAIERATEYAKARAAAKAAREAEKAAARAAGAARRAGEKQKAGDAKADQRARATEAVQAARAERAIAAERARMAAPRPVRQATAKTATRPKAHKSATTVPAGIDRLALMRAAMAKVAARRIKAAEDPDAVEERLMKLLTKA